MQLNALTAVGALMTLIDFTLSNARRFYSSIGNPLGGKGLITLTLCMCILVSSNPLKAYRHVFQCLHYIISMHPSHQGAHI